MLFYMTSKVFFKEFLNNERDQDILDAQYVLISLRIKTLGESENVLNLANYLFPDTVSLMCNDKDAFKDIYYNQLDDNIGILATTVLGDVKGKYNAIFLCTPNEMKIPYMEAISEFIYDKFGYPMYEYEKYIYDGYKDIKINKKKVIKKCKKILGKLETENYLDSKKCKYEDNLNKLKNNKKAMKSILKTQGLYEKGMSKSDMIEELELEEDE